MRTKSNTVEEVVAEATEEVVAEATEEVVAEATPEVVAEATIEVVEAVESVAEATPQEQKRGWRQ